MDDNKSKALAAALAQIEKQFGKGSIMRWATARWTATSRSVSTGSLGLDIALGIGGLPRGRVVEIYGPESSGKTTLTLQVIAEMQKLGGTAAFIDAEHALDPQYAAEARRERRRPADLPARHRRAGPRDRRHAGALGRHRRGGDRLGRGADAEGRDRGRDGRPAARPAGPPDEPGAAQAHRQHQAHQHPGHLHQPDPHEDRRHVRQPGDHHRRQRAEVLRLGAPRHPPHRQHQEGRGSHRLRDPRQGRQEQGGAAVPPGRIRHPLRRGHLARGRDHRARRAAQARRQVRRLVRLQRRAHRPGQGQRPRVPQGAPDVAREIENKVRAAVGLWPSSRPPSRPRLERRAERQGAAAAGPARAFPRRTGPQAGLRGQPGRDRSVLDQLEQAGLLSDARFAEAFVFVARGALRRGRLRHDLRARASPRKSSPGPAAGCRSEAARAREVWRRKFGAGAPPTAPTTPARRASCKARLRNRHHSQGAQGTTNELLKVTGLQKEIQGAHRRQDVSFEVEERRGGRPARPQRRRQDHLLLHDRRPGGADGGEIASTARR
jgi:hypothetical protein